MTVLAVTRGRRLRPWMVQAALAVAVAALASLVATRGVVAGEAAVAAGIALLMASGVVLVLRDQHDDNQV